MLGLGFLTFYIVVTTEIFTGRTDAEAPILWPPEAKSQLRKRYGCSERLRTGEGGGR